MVQNSSFHFNRPLNLQNQTLLKQIALGYIQ
jgi:hypothetical protein